LRLYFFGIGETLCDELAPILQHLKDRLIGEPVKKKTDDAETNHLGYQMRPVHTETLGNLLDLPAAFCFRHKNKCIHKLKLQAGEPPLGTAPAFFALFHKEQDVKHDRLSKGNGQNGLNQNLGGRSRVAAYYIRSSSADNSHGNSCSESCQTYVQILNHVMSFLSRRL